MGLRLGADLDPLEITWKTALDQQSSYHFFKVSKPEGLRAIRAVSSTLACELRVKLQLPTNAVRVEAANITFA